MSSSISEDKVEKRESEIREIVRENWVEDEMKSNYVNSKKISRYCDLSPRQIGKTLPEISWLEEDAPGYNSVVYRIDLTEFSQN